IQCKVDHHNTIIKWSNNVSTTKLEWSISIVKQNRQSLPQSVTVRLNAQSINDGYCLVIIPSIGNGQLQSSRSGSSSCSINSRLNNRRLIGRNQSILVPTGGSSRVG